MTLARRNCRARCALESATAHRSSTARSQSASSHSSEVRSRASATGVSAAVGVTAPSWSDPGHDGRCLAKRVAPEVATPFPPLLIIRRCTDLPCFALETDSPLTKVSHKMHIFAYPEYPNIYINI